MFITNDIYYVGVNDHRIDLFEGQYRVPNGISYNSYLIMDEKIAILDTVDISFASDWLNNVRGILQDREPDYLIVQHMEPDHSANVLTITEVFPNITVVASAKAFSMMSNFFGTDFSNRRIIVKEGDSLSLGKHQLCFVSAPMVHWPEVIVTYDTFDKVLFSADGFGKFGALDVSEPWEDEARRYYIGIVGKYGAPVQALLKKASNLPINCICPLHGPVLSSNLSEYLHYYQLWSTYQSEQPGVVIAYCSVYGNTKHAAELLYKYLEEKGLQKVVIYDLARCDLSMAVADAFKYDKLVLATPTYNGDMFPFMKDFLSRLEERSYANKTIAFIENGSWSPSATKKMKDITSKFKNIKYTDTEITINSAVNEAVFTEIRQLAKELE